MTFRDYVRTYKLNEYSNAYDDQSYNRVDYLLEYLEFLHTELMIKQQKDINAAIDDYESQRIFDGDDLGIFDINDDDDASNGLIMLISNIRQIINE